MATTAIAFPSPEEVLPRWQEELQASDHAKGTIRWYRSAVEGFLAWYSREEQRPLAFSTLTPIALVGYRNYVQRTQQRATSTVNGQISTLRAFWGILPSIPRESIASPPLNNFLSESSNYHRTPTASIRGEK